MRVVVAPDKFAGTLTSAQAAEAIVSGWSRAAPADQLVTVPMSDGGPGFVQALHAALGGDLVATTVMDPYGVEVPAAFLLVGGTAYVECAQAVGLQLTPPEQRRPEAASSAGLGRLLRSAVGCGPRRVIVGLGGSATNDGGAGLLAELGATTQGGSLRLGPAGLARIESVDLTAAKETLRGVQLVAATDVDAQLTGLFGATRIFGPQKGLSEERLPAVDAMLLHYAEVTDRRLATVKGAGAAGGIGFALLLLGATREPGVDLVADAVGLAQLIGSADLVVTGEGAFDFSSRGGKVPAGVAALAAQAARPCVVLAGRVGVGSREVRALGIESAYAVEEYAGRDRALGDPGGTLADLAERVARTWSR